MSVEKRPLPFESDSFGVIATSLASPGPIGGTTPGAITATTVTAQSVTASSPVAAAIVYRAKTFDASSAITPLYVFARSDDAVAGHIAFDGGTAKMMLRTTTAHNFQLGANGATVLELVSGGGVLITGGVTHSSPTLLNTSVALTNGAAAQVATLTNGPTAGNPTKWIPVVDNGTTRYIPAW